MDKPCTSSSQMAGCIDDTRCDVCKMSEKDQFLYGEFITKLGFNVHYFCLLSCTRMLQLGKKQNSGIYGFLAVDIRAAIELIKDKTCVYCDKKSAGCECAELGCTRNFHYICGFKNNCITEFLGEFQSFCHDHIRVGNHYNHEPEYPCDICFEPMGEDNPVSSIIPTCCDAGFFHRSCMTRFAAEAGYYTNCPFCAEQEGEKNGEKNFLGEMRYRGIFIPQRDATWEREKGAFGDLVKNRCLAEGCECPTKAAKEGKYRIITCIVCGCGPHHAKCLDVPPEEYHCVDCKNKTFLNILKKH